MEESLWLTGFNYFAQGGLRECVTAPGMSTQKTEGGVYQHHWFKSQETFSWGKKFTWEQPWMMLPCYIHAPGNYSFSNLSKLTSSPH